MRVYQGMIHKRDKRQPNKQTNKPKHPWTFSLRMHNYRARIKKQQCVCVRACERVCVCACVRGCVCYVTAVFPHAEVLRVDDEEGVAAVI